MLTDMWNEVVSDNLVVALFGAGSKICLLDVLDPVAKKIGHSEIGSGYWYVAVSLGK